MAGREAPETARRRSPMGPHAARPSRILSWPATLLFVWWASRPRHHVPPTPGEPAAALALLDAHPGSAREDDPAGPGFGAGRALVGLPFASRRRTTCWPRGCSGLRGGSDPGAAHHARDDLDHGPRHTRAADVRHDPRLRHVPVGASSRAAPPSASTGGRRRPGSSAASRRCSPSISSWCSCRTRRSPPELHRRHQRLRPAGLRVRGGPEVQRLCRRGLQHLAGGGKEARAVATALPLIVLTLLAITPILLRAAEISSRRSTVASRARRIRLGAWRWMATSSAPS